MEVDRLQPILTASNLLTLGNDKIFLSLLSLKRSFYIETRTGLLDPREVVESVWDFQPLHDWTQKALAMAVRTVMRKLMMAFLFSFFMIADFEV